MRVEGFPNAVTIQRVLPILAQHAPPTTIDKFVKDVERMGFVIPRREWIKLGNKANNSVEVNRYVRTNKPQVNCQC